MDKNIKHSALDDYFSSMLSVPVVEEPKVEKLVAEPQLEILIEQTNVELKPQLVESVAVPQHDFAIPEPDGSGSLSDLDLLLGSVIDIDLADIDLSVLDNAKPVVETVLDDIVEIAAPETVEQAITLVEDDVVVTSLSDSTEELDVDVIPEVVEPIAEHSTGTATFSPVESTVELTTAVELDDSEDAELAWKNVELEERFQALFFEVAGVTFAVPLTELGGIHQIETVNSLFGKPDWYLGIMQHRDQKLSVVDTAQWVMPEQNMGEIDYKYQIQLSQSNWVLGCESLHGTETLSSNDIKWRSTPGSRPWLAGMVKSRMCVLLHVTEMIKLLDNGINIHGQ